MDKLSEIESRLAILINNTDEGLLILDRYLNVLAFNQALENEYYRFYKKPMQKGTNVREYESEERLKCIEEICTEVLLGISRTYEISFQTETDEEIYYLLKYKPVYDEQKNILGLFITVHDITEQKIREADLQLKERRYKSLIENCADTVVIFSKEGEVIYVSPSIKSILGYEPEEFINLRFSNIIHPDDVQKNLRVVAKSLENPGVPISGYISRLKHKDGSWQWADAIMTNLIQDPSIAGIINNFRIITDRIQAEQASQDSHNKLQEVMDQSIDLICVLDTKGNFIQVSKSCYTILGYTEEEMLDLNYAQLIFPEDKEETERIAQEIVLEQKVKYIKNRYVHKDGHNVNLEWSVKWDEASQTVYCIARDVTDLNKAKEKIEKKDKEIAGILASVTDGFVAIRKDWVMTYWNDQAEILIQKPRDLIVGKVIWDVFPEAVSLKFYSGYMKAMQERVTVRLEEFYPPLQIWIEANIYPAEEGISVFFKDITFRKNNEELIRLAKEKYEIVSKAVQEAIWDWDFETDKLEWGEGFFTLFGYPIDTLSTKIDSWTARIHPDDFELTMNSILAVANSESESSWSAEYRFLKADRNWCTVWDKGYLIRDATNKAVRMIGAMQDISQMKGEETRLKILESVITHTTDSVMITDVHFADETGPRIIFVNEAYVKITGYSADEVIGRSPGFLQGPDTNPEIIQKIRDALLNFEASQFEMLGYKKNKDVMWMEFTIVPVANSKGVYTHWISIAHDITDRKNNEQNLEKLANELEDKVFQRTLELQNANQKLSYQNTQINESIRYATKIQNAIFSDTDSLNFILKSFFIFSKPRDIISGDFIWYRQEKNKLYFALADCTGHGVPGAVLSILGHTIFEEIFQNQHLSSPGFFLNLVFDKLKKILYDKPDKKTTDGMDVAFCILNFDNNTLLYSGFHRPLYFVHNDEFTEYLPEKLLAGNADLNFTDTKIYFEAGDRFYIASDGFQSQFGGEKYTKMMRKDFRGILKSISLLPFPEQKDSLQKTFEKWSNGYKQIDDVLVIGGLL